MFAPFASPSIGRAASASPPVFVTTGFARSAASNTVTVSGMSGILAGDRIYILAFITANLSTASSSGFTTVADASYLSTISGSVLVKVAAGGETGFTVPFSAGIGACSAYVLVYRNVTTATYGTLTGVTGNTSSFPNMTQAGGGLLIATASTNAAAAGLFLASSTARINTAPSGGPGCYAYEKPSTAGTSAASTSGGGADFLMCWAMELL